MTYLHNASLDLYDHILLFSMEMFLEMTST